MDYDKIRERMLEEMEEEQETRRQVDGLTTLLITGTMIALYKSQNGMCIF